jgi:serine/threonine protein kinase
MREGEVARKLPSGWQRDDPEWICESGQAWVYRVRRAGDQRRYALKRLKNLTRRDRFAREIRAMIALRQQGLTAIPEVVEHDLEDNPWPYLVTPWYNDGSLADRITAGARGDDVANLDLCRVLARALHEVHRHGYAHRDLKPENLLFDGETLGLGDFGLCLEVDNEQRLTSTSEAVGSRYFIAPENEGGMNEANDQRPGDLYAFGKLLWCILTGRRPFPREQQLQSGYRLVDILERKEITPLDALCTQLLDTDARSRLADWPTVLAELGQVHATLTGTRKPRPPHRSIGSEALAQARRVSALPAVQQAAADQARARKIQDWVALLRRDLSVEADQQFSAALQEIVDASGRELQISVGGSGGHDPVALFALQPALSVPGLEINRVRAQDGMFAAVQLLAFGSRAQLPGVPRRALSA